ncbi:MAG: PEP-CTERM sorting domain-containing protein [Verrucomicrobiia bacterium]
MLALALVAAPLAAEGQTYTFIDLTPSGFSRSQATGISGGHQVGWGSGMDGNSHAFLWSSTAASAVDLNPSGFTMSEAIGISGGHQVGSGYTGSSFHALLWSGTAASAVDLNPSGLTTSCALGISGGHQVGWGTLTSGGNTNALLWSGTAASAVDLQNFLPSNYTYSEACGIDANGDIVGWAYNSSTGQQDAMLWVLVPEPATVSLLALGLGVLFMARRLRSPMSSAPKH